MTWLRDSVLGGLRHALPLPFRKACFLLFIYIEDGSILVGFQVLKCPCLCFFGVLSWLNL